MNSSNNTTAFYYYLSVTILAIVFCIALLGVLNWPLLAEIPLSLCIFFQIIALSRSLFNTWSNSSSNELIEDVFARTKAHFFSLETQEEEVVNIWESKKAS